MALTSTEADPKKKGGRGMSQVSFGMLKTTRAGFMFFFFFFWFCFWFCFCRSEWKKVTSDEEEIGKEQQIYETSLWSDHL